MNERFHALPEEKQTLILNAAMAVFARYGYKKSSAEEIASQAEISKGLLFHYFTSKNELYLYLATYAMQYLLAEMRRDFDREETDFFRMLVNAQTIKIAIMNRYPDLLSFLANAYLETDPAVADWLGAEYGDQVAQSRKIVLARADASKFKQGVSMEQTLDLILWMSDGLMRSRKDATVQTLEVINAQYLECLNLLRNNLYREEAL